MRYAAAMLLALLVTSGSARAFTITWVSETESEATLELGPFASFSYTKPDGTSISFNGGLLGASWTFKDKKKQGGGLEIEIADLALLSDNSYGTSGEPAVVLPGTVVAAQAEFELALAGFTNVADQTLTFSAELLQVPTANGIQINAFGQGDQLADGKNGSVSFLTVWRSTDVLAVLDDAGATVFDMPIGDFALPATGLMSEFDFVLDLTQPFPEFSANFIVDEEYMFLFDGEASDLFATDNIRNRGVSGAQDVSVMSTVPLPASIALLPLGFLSLLRFRRRWLVS